MTYKPTDEELKQRVAEMTERAEKAKHLAGADSLVAKVAELERDVFVLQIANIHYAKFFDNFTTLITSHDQLLRKLAGL